MNSNSYKFNQNDHKEYSPLFEKGKQYKFSFNGFNNSGTRNGNMNVNININNKDLNIKYSNRKIDHSFSSGRNMFVDIIRSSGNESYKSRNMINKINDDSLNLDIYNIVLQNKLNDNIGNPFISNEYNMKDDIKVNFLSNLSNKRDIILSDSKINNNSEMKKKNLLRNHDHSQINKCNNKNEGMVLVSNNHNPINYTFYNTSINYNYLAKKRKKKSKINNNLSHKAKANSNFKKNRIVKISDLHENIRNFNGFPQNELKIENQKIFSNVSKQIYDDVSILREKSIIDNMFKSNNNFDDYYDYEIGQFKSENEEMNKNNLNALSKRKKNKNQESDPDKKNLNDTLQNQLSLCEISDIPKYFFHNEYQMVNNDKNNNINFNWVREKFEYNDFSSDIDKSFESFKRDLLKSKHKASILKVQKNLGIKKENLPKELKENCFNGIMEFINSKKKTSKKKNLDTNNLKTPEEIKNSININTNTNTNTNTKANIKKDVKSAKQVHNKKYYLKLKFSELLKKYEDELKNQKDYENEDINNNLDKEIKNSNIQRSNVESLLFQIKKFLIKSLDCIIAMRIDIYNSVKNKAVVYYNTIDKSLIKDMKSKEFLNIDDNYIKNKRNCENTQQSDYNLETTSVKENNLAFTENTKGNFLDFSLNEKNCNEVKTINIDGIEERNKKLEEDIIYNKICLIRNYLNVLDFNVELYSKNMSTFYFILMKLSYLAQNSSINFTKSVKLFHFFFRVIDNNFSVDKFISIKFNKYYNYKTNERTLNRFNKQKLEIEKLITFISKGIMTIIKSYHEVNKIEIIDNDFLTNLLIEFKRLTKLMTKVSFSNTALSDNSNENSLNINSFRRINFGKLFEKTEFVDLARIIEKSQENKLNIGKKNNINNININNDCSNFISFNDFNYLNNIVKDDEKLEDKKFTINDSKNNETSIKKNIYSNLISEVLLKNLNFDSKENQSFDNNFQRQLVLGDKTEKLININPFENILKPIKEQDYINSNIEFENCNNCRMDIMKENKSLCNSSQIILDKLKHGKIDVKVKKLIKIDEKQLDSYFSKENIVEVMNNKYVNILNDLSLQEKLKNYNYHLRIDSNNDFDLKKDQEEINFSRKGLDLINTKISNTNKKRIFNIIKEYKIKENNNKSTKKVRKVIQKDKKLSVKNENENFENEKNHNIENSLIIPEFSVDGRKNKNDEKDNKDQCIIEYLDENINKSKDENLNNNNIEIDNEKLEIQNSIDGTIYNCNYCNKKFQSCYALGGHTSRKHPMSSERYTKKLGIRIKRINIRSVIILAKVELFNFLNLDYLDLIGDAAFGKDKIRIIIKENDKIYKKLLQHFKSMMSKNKHTS